jgi:hypothetical protein
MMPIAVESAEQTPQEVWQYSVDQVRRWCHICDTLLKQERAKILEGEPTQVELEQHRTNLKWFLRLSKLYYTLVSDPEFPDRTLIAELDAKIWQLEESWKMIFEPMPANEARTILSEVFPGYDAA